MFRFIYLHMAFGFLHPASVTSGTHAETYRTHVSSLCFVRWL
jgi:hypothetical protein